MFKNKAILVIASAMLGMPVAMQAQVTPTAAGKGSTVGADQIIQRYASFAGGEANATSLVNGLRNGVEITLSWTEEKCTQHAQGACTLRDTNNCIERNPDSTTTSCVAGTSSNGATCKTSTTTQGCSLPTLLNGRPAQCTVGTAGCICPGQIISTTTCTAYNDVCSPTTVQGSCKTFACVQYAEGPCTKTEPQTNSLKFSPGPAAPMGFGNVDIALALTEAALRPNATPPAATLRDKLLEILGKRAAGDGWGKIAKSYGLQLQE